MGFPGDSVVKNPPASAGDTGDAGSIPGWGRSPGEGNGNPLQYSCLRNPMDRGVWRATVHGVTKESGTTEQLSACTYTHTHTHTHSLSLSLSIVAKQSEYFLSWFLYRNAYLLQNLLCKWFRSLMFCC